MVGSIKNMRSLVCYSYIVTQTERNVGAMTHDDPSLEQITLLYERMTEFARQHMQHRDAAIFLGLLHHLLEERGKYILYTHTVPPFGQEVIPRVLQIPDQPLPDKETFAWENPHPAQPSSDKS